MSFWQGKRVLVTGHTGFKGSWLSLWLLDLGATVSGLALAPDTRPALFDQLGLARDMDHRVVDVRDAAGVAATVKSARPDIVLHLAAQPLVLRGYREPIETWATNVMGTVHVLEALRRLERPATAVVITTDKVYHNDGSGRAWREDDRLGGHDPYSASKAACEIAVDCWRRSYLAAGGVRVASARAGNVIGGGDWAENRIVPDMMRALAGARRIEVRNPRATRPWQHVLEPLGGYLLLAERLHGSAAPDLQDAFNFGPPPEAERSVAELVSEVLRHWPGEWDDVSRPGQPHEAERLSLDIGRAEQRMGWRPRWDFARTVAETVIWYREAGGLSSGALRDLTLGQIRTYRTETASAPS